MKCILAHKKKEKKKPIAGLYSLHGRVSEREADFEISDVGLTSIGCFNFGAGQQLCVKARGEREKHLLRIL